MKLFRFFTFAAILVICGCYTSNAQVYTGGSFGAHIDNKGYYVDIAPLLGYRYGIMDVGISPFYSYRNNKDSENRYSYGSRVFTQVTIIRNVYAHAEFEAANIDVPGDDDRKWIFGFPVGAGYRQKIAPNTQAYGMILYDLMLDEDSSVDNPIVRAGVTYSF